MWVLDAMVPDADRAAFANTKTSSKVRGAAPARPRARRWRHVLRQISAKGFGLISTITDVAVGMGLTGLLSGQPMTMRAHRENLADPYSGSIHDFTCASNQRHTAAAFSSSNSFAVVVTNQERRGSSRCEHG